MRAAGAIAAAPRMPNLRGFELVYLGTKGGFATLTFRGQLGNENRHYGVDKPRIAAL
jgi:hypothetical protein